MITNHFNQFINSLENLNTLQDRILRHKLQEKANKKHVSLNLETAFEDIHCPHCNNEDLYRWGKRSDMQRYRCKKCKKTFNSLTNTPLARLKRKGHWLDYAQCMKEGLSIRKTAKVCNISTKTSFRWRHRFLQNVKHIKPGSLEGIIEADETYYLKSEKGSRNLKRKPRKRGGIKLKNNNKPERVCVIIGRDRNKNTYDSIINKFNAINLSKSLKKHIGADALFCSNSSSVYKKFAKNESIRHGYINISKGEFVKKDIVHIYNVQNYQHKLKDWIQNHFHGVATKYLENYLGWFRELDEFDNKISALTILYRAKNIGVYKLQPLTPT